MSKKKNSPTAPSLVPRSYGFVIERALSNAARIQVEGRCLEETIALGERFSKVGIPLLPGVQPGAIDWVPVDLRVESIQMYGRACKSLSGGMTAALVLSGTGGALLVPGGILMS